MVRTTVRPAIDTAQKLSDEILEELVLKCITNGCLQGKQNYKPYCKAKAPICQYYQDETMEVTDYTDMKKYQCHLCGNEYMRKKRKNANS